VLVRWSFLNCLLPFFRIQVFFVGKKVVIFVSEASLFVYILFKFCTLTGINNKSLNTGTNLEGFSQIPEKKQPKLSKVGQ
jgi:hypothetical protein